MSEKLTASTSTKEKVEKYVTTLADVVPAQAKPYLLKAAPVLAQIADFIDKLLPILQDYYQKFLIFWKKVEPYRPELLIPGFAGLIMCFFGGSFLTLIAAVEAYRMCGYETTMACINNLIEDFQKVADANKKDDEVDADGDGVADVMQTSNRHLIQRKTLLFLKTIDPKRLTDALAGINAGLLAVVATLKLEFAKTITLGKCV